MPGRQEDVLYCIKFRTEGAEAPGDHILAFRSSGNRVIASQHLRQIVEAKNNADPEAEMSIQSMTRCTQEELDAEVAKLRASGVVRVDAADVYPDEKERNKIIAPSSGGRATVGPSSGPQYPT